MGKTQELLYLFVLVLLLLSFCGCKTTKYEPCSPPYIRYHSDYCCLDSNNNNVCDMNERLVKSPCADQCNQSYCKGSSFVQCLVKLETCKKTVEIGKVIGECGVQCLSDDDCSWNETCRENICSLGRIECYKNCYMGIKIIDEALAGSSYSFSIINNNTNACAISCTIFLESEMTQSHGTYTVAYKAAKHLTQNVPLNDALYIICGTLGSKPGCRDEKKQAYKFTNVLLAANSTILPKYVHSASIGQ